jgi:phage-related protein
MKSGIINTIHGIVSAVTGLKTKIVSTLKGINLASVGRQVIQGFINGIKSMAGAVGSAIKSVAGNVTKKIKGELGIHSPSRVFMEIGAFTGEGLAIGISDMEDMVARATQGLADASFGTINSEEINPIKGKVQPGQTGQTGDQTNYNAPLMNIENYYQNTDTDVSSLSNGLFNLDRKSKRKKGK